MQLKMYLLSALALVPLWGTPQDKPSEVQQPQEVVLPEVLAPHTFPPFTYQVVTEWGDLGNEFIMEGQVYTAKHVFVENSTGLDHCISLGKHPVHMGLTRSVKDPVPRDDLFYLSTRGMVQLEVLFLDTNYLYVGVFEGHILPGDSGSPVFDSEGKVVGAVSFTSPAHPYMKAFRSGVIGRFVP